MKKLPSTFLNMFTGAQVAPEEWQKQLKPGDYYMIESFDLNLPSVYGRILRTADAGFFHVEGHSAWCKDGEEGIVCIVEPTRKLTEDEFLAAQSNGWPQTLNRD